MRSRSVLVVTPNGAAAVGSRSAEPPLGQARIDWSSADEQVAHALEPLFAGRGSVDVVVHDRAVRYCVVVPPKGTASLDELRAVASARMSDLYGAAGVDLELAADWRAFAPFLCCGIPRAVGRALLQAARSAGASIRSIVPLFVHVVNSEPDCRRHSGWVLVRTGGYVAAGLFDRGAIRLVRCGHVDAKRSLESWLSQLAVSSGHAVERPLVLDTVSPEKLPGDWSRLSGRYTGLTAALVSPGLA
jgi:hypothetical protein